MTYAELYGNIKKRPLKCGLGNIMIDAIAELNINKVDAILGYENFDKVGDIMSGINKAVSPITQKIEDINTRVNDAFSQLDTSAYGINMPTL